jgi:1-acyl-sn-glycerol-3-phosphate acyltransferase
MREQVYADSRSKEHFDRFHARARRRGPDGLYEVLRVLVSTFAWVVFRLRSMSPERVPASGPVILAPNHFSFLDHFFVGIPIRRKVRFMAKSQLFTGPLAWVISHGGAFPVRRGARDEDTFVTAGTILDRGGCVVMYCEGGRSRTGRLSERARPGIGRLALESGATVVPVAIHGSSRVRNWRRLQFPRITIAYGEPLRYQRVAAPSRGQQRAAADEIFTEIKALYAAVDAGGGA